MVDDDFVGCEICGDDLCPGCEPSSIIPRFVSIGLSALVLLAVGWGGMHAGRWSDIIGSKDQGTTSIQAQPSSTASATSVLITPTSAQPTTSPTPSSTSSSTAAPRPNSVGPLDHPLLAQRPAAVWFWQPSCSLCGIQAEFLAKLVARWSPTINFVGVPINGESIEQLNFLGKYKIELPQIDDGDGSLSTLFEISGTPTWGFVYPDGTYKSVDTALYEKDLSQELNALARFAPLTIIDTASESVVRSAFEREFGLKPPPLGWTGSVSDCEPGTTNRVHQEATLSRVNWYRAMAGVEPNVTLNDQYTMYAQAAALTMLESGRLSHDPDGSFNCLTEWSHMGASRSNLSLGDGGPESIDGYIEDYGADNYSVGHRRWILLPELLEIGTGDTKSTNALLVVGDKENPNAKTRERGLVMWPPRGYVPRSTIYPRWSVSAERAFSGGVHVLVRNQTRVLYEDLEWPDSGIGWPTLIFSIPTSSLGKGPIDVEIYENNNGRPGVLITRYQVMPID